MIVDNRHRSWELELAHGFHVPAAHAGSIRLAVDRRYELEVDRLTLGGFTLVARNGLESGEVRGELHLGHLRLDPCRIALESGPRRGGRKFRVGRVAELDRTLADRWAGAMVRRVVDRRLVSPPSQERSEETIRDEKRVQQVLGAVLAWGRPLWVVTRRGVSVPCRRVEVLPGGMLSVRPSGADPLDAPPVAICFEGFNAEYEGEILECERHGDGFRLRPPPVLKRVFRRWQRRVEAPAHLHVRFAHPLEPGRVVEYAVSDISFLGLGFFGHPLETGLFPGMVLRRVLLCKGGRVLVAARAEVLTLNPPPASWSHEAPRWRHGLRLCELETPHRESWYRLVERGLHPNTRNRADWSRRAWDLFDASGYFRLSGKRPDEFVDMKPAFEAVSDRIDGAPEVGCTAIWPSSRGVEAVVSHLRVGEMTWLIYQVAMRPGRPPSGESGRTLLREIFLRAFEHAHRDPGIRWLIGYTEAHIRWNRRVLLDFAAPFVERERAAVVPFHLMEIPTSSDVPAPHTPPSPGLATNVPPPEAGWSARPVSAEELPAALAGIREHLAPAHCEALDLVPGRFHLPRARRVWARAEMERDRELLVLREGRVVRGWAVLDAGTVGTSLFRLVDGLRLVVAGPDEAAVLRAVLPAARAWYARRGRRCFSLFWYRESAEVPESLGIRDLGLGYVWILAAALMPEFLENLFEASAPRGAARPAGGAPAGADPADRASRNPE